MFTILNQCTFELYQQVAILVAYFSGDSWLLAIGSQSQIDSNWATLRFDRANILNLLYSVEVGKLAIEHHASAITYEPNRHYAWNYGVAREMALEDMAI